MWVQTFFVQIIYCSAGELCRLYSACIVAWSAPSHYRGKCLKIVNSNLRNKRQWNLNRNSYIFIQENAFKMSSAKWRQFCFGLNVIRMGARTLFVWEALGLCLGYVTALTCGSCRVSDQGTILSASDRKNSLASILSTFSTSFQTCMLLRIVTW